jgi:hypothetical protein
MDEQDLPEPDPLPPMNFELLPVVSNYAFISSPAASSTKLMPAYDHDHIYQQYPYAPPTNWYPSYVVYEVAITIREYLGDSEQDHKDCSCFVKARYSEMRKVYHTVCFSFFELRKFEDEEGDRRGRHYQREKEGEGGRNEEEKEFRESTVQRDDEKSVPRCYFIFKEEGKTLSVRRREKEGETRKRRREKEGERGRRREKEGEGGRRRIEIFKSF